MKKNLFLYLFIFALLINVFTYMYFSSKQKFDDGRVEKMHTRVKSLKDSIVTLSDANYFSLESNGSAKRNLVEGQDIDQLIIKIRDGILAKNDPETGNPLVGYPAMNGKAFIIGKLKVLNDRWVIADFSNNRIDGQVIIKYFLEEDGKITFETAETVLYTEE